MDVVVIDTDGAVLARGRWEGKRVDSEFAKIDGELYHVAYVYDARYADMVSAALAAQKKEMDTLKDRHMANLLDMANKYRARP